MEFEGPYYLEKSSSYQQRWDFVLKQDRLWIKWVHMYDIKHKDFGPCLSLMNLHGLYEENMAK